MTEPYKKVGRGGAGNFYTPQDVEDINKATEPTDDIEAQTSPTDTDTASLARALNASRPPPEYLHSGRGGAGNWFQPAELSSQGLVQAANSSATATEAPRKGAVLSKPTYRGGRGGAGNYVDFAAQEREKREEEERRRREMEARIGMDVEAGLARPARAYGGVGGAFEMGRMG